MGDLETNIITKNIEVRMQLIFQKLNRYFCAKWQLAVLDLNSLTMDYIFLQQEYPIPES